MLYLYALIKWQNNVTHTAIVCSKLTIKTLQWGYGIYSKLTKRSKN